MPTGYTAGVQDGTVTDFREFAMQCARAFGALILMRDEPSNASIPEAFSPSQYHIGALARTQAELEALRAMTPEQADAAAAEAHADACAAYERRKAERVAQRERYEAMLAKVRAWEPPTVEHVGLKDFMVKQIVESIDFDCSERYDDPPDALTGRAWHERETKRLHESVGYHAKRQAEEVARTEGRNTWVRQLRESLNAVAEAQGATK